MVSMYQMQAVGELVTKGWVILGPAENTMGGRTLMSDPHGHKFFVGADGHQMPAPADAKPVEGWRKLPLEEMEVKPTQPADGPPS